MIGTCPSQVRPSTIGTSRPNLAARYICSPLALFCPALHFMPQVLRTRKTEDKVTYHRIELRNQDRNSLFMLGKSNNAIFSLLHSLKFFLFDGFDDASRREEAQLRGLYAGISSITQDSRSLSIRSYVLLCAYNLLGHFCDVLILYLILNNLGKSQLPKLPTSYI